MAGSRANHARRSGRAARIAVLILSLAARSEAQLARKPVPAPTDTGFVALDDPSDARQGLAAVARTWDDLDSDAMPRVAWTETGIFDTMTESIFGQSDPDNWRPLPFSTFFSKGWRETWLPSPRGSGGAPRQGWINAVEGTMNRVWLFTFSYGYNSPPKSNAYLGSYTLLTPLSRRLMLITSIPFVLRNNADSGLPIIDPPGPTAATTRSHTGFGDISFTPRVLLHETKDFSLTAEFAVLTPTGDRPVARKSSLTPAVGFWYNFEGGWAIRGGIGDLIPTQSGGNTLISQLAVGQTLTKHDVPLFGDFTYYLSTVVRTPLSGGDRTSVTLTPGMRTHLGRDWYFLAGLPTPLTKARVADLGLIFWFMKTW
jgi:hypothetical protein